VLSLGVAETKKPPVANDKANLFTRIAGNTRQFSGNVQSTARKQKGRALRGLSLPG
jgi:hypothetical protein